MAVNKVILNNEVLIDLTADTAAEANVESGKTFHKADGTIGTGSLVLPSGTIEIIAIGTHNVKNYEIAEVNPPVYDGEIEDVAALITFTIDGTEYQALEGMTWWEWCESEYNTDGYMGGGFHSSGIGYVDGMDDDTVLTDGAAYTVVFTGDGGNE